MVRRALRQRAQGLGDAHDATIERQFGAEQMQLLEIEAQRPLALHGERLRRHVGRDEGIAVAVAADPAPHAQEGRHVEIAPGRIDAAQAILQVGVEDGQSMKEGVVVVGEAVGDLVDHPEALAAHQAGLPQGEHGTAQRPAVGGELLRRELHAVALVEQLRNLHLAVDRALATDFRRMRRQDRAAERVGEERLQLSARDAGVAGAIERVGHGALAGQRFGHGIGTGAADVMLVFGEVGEMREIAEGPDDAQRLVRRQAAHDGLQFLSGGLVGLAVELDSGAPDAFDELEHRVTFLGAYRVAQDAPEQPDVVAQREVLLGRFAGVQGFHGRQHNTSCGAGFDIRVNRLRWHTNCMHSGQFA